MLPTRFARIICIIGDVLVTFLLVGIVEQQTWPFRDWLQLILFVLLWVEVYIIWSWGRPAEKKTLYLSGILIILFSLLLLFSMAEVFFRARTAYIPRQVMNALPGRGEYLHTDIFLFDDAPIQVGRRFHPNQNAPISGQAREILAWNGRERFFYLPERDETQIHFVTDENGYRNLSPLAGQYDVVVSGDSFTLGMEVDTPWPELLSETIGQSVLNLSVVGYGPQAETAAIRLYGLPKNPNTIIIAYFEGNDLRDAQNYAEAQQEKFTFSQSLAGGAPWNRQLVSLTAVRVLAGGFARLVGLGSEAARLPESKIPVYPAAVTVNGQEMALSFLDGYVAMLTARQEEIEMSDNWRAVSAALLEAQQLAQENNSRLILVYIPSKPHVYLPLLPGESANAITTTAGRIRVEAGKIVSDVNIAGLPYEQFMAHIDDQARTVANFAQSNNIEFLNLTPVFQDEAAQGKVLYLALGTHWNLAGHQLAAQTIADYLAPER